MSESVNLPALGESVTEGTVTRWLKNVGDRVEVDEPLLEVSTDKVDTEIPSPIAGVIEAILVAEDETVEVGTPLVTIGDGSGGGAPAAPAPAEAVAEAPVEAPPKLRPRRLLLHPPMPRLRLPRHPLPGRRPPSPLRRRSSRRSPWSRLPRCPRPMHPRHRMRHRVRPSHRLPPSTSNLRPPKPQLPPPRRTSAQKRPVPSRLPPHSPQSRLSNRPPLLLLQLLLLQPLPLQPLPLQPPRHPTRPT